MHPNPYNNLLAKRSLAPAARTASANGTTVDRAEDDAMFQDALVVIDAGVVTDGTHTFEVQESDDGASWSAAADEDLQGAEPAVTAANDDTVYEIGYLGAKRYVRVAVTVTGGPATGGVYGAAVVLSNPRRAPVVRA
ncbi:hypothetical protein [Streptomyces sp. TRM68416]|uniref:hypothetical protein n=1 Tax=Streptomyces sp. TRM68416 TaxID=2758412 RepID=UPI001661A190|nr:hypothetical protein [Streptomyces sp. TRM68416]MBD0837375.1 hypothetical protein [Streptomyces sp. TRM68416]